MSLHRYDAPPPLAIAIHPAPPKPLTPPKAPDDPESQNKDKHEKRDENNKKDNDNDDKDKDKKADKHADVPKDHAIACLKPASEGKGQTQPKGISPLNPAPVQPHTPASSSSMQPEPPTPLPRDEGENGEEKGKKVAQIPSPKPAQREGKLGIDEGKAPHPSQNAAAEDAKNATAEGEESKNKGDEGQSPNKSDAKEENQPEKTETEDEPVELTPEPIRLISPPPPRPLRTKLDIHPSNPYPRINTDPRGAYNKYARSMYMEQHYIDITKDGWLFDQWKGRAEREALARLNGEAEKQYRREMEEAQRVSRVRKVPDSAEGILLDLWNDLVMAPANELSTEAFWSRYDWSPPAAQVHLLDIKREVEGEGKSEDEGESKSERKGEVEKKKPVTVDGQEIEWTKEGLEEILASVGVSCGYNLEVPLPRNPHEPTVSYLILGHGHFMLRREEALQWQREDKANKFEILVTSGHDRVFGDMVRQKQMAERRKKEEEYRKRKYLEKKKAEEAKKLDQDGDKDEGREKEEGDKADDLPKRDQDGGEKKDMDDDAPSSPTSVAKVRDGKEVKRKIDTRSDEIIQNRMEAGNAVAVLGTEGKAAIAVPVKADKEDLVGDAKHEVDVKAAAPGEAGMGQDKATEVDGDAKPAQNGATPAANKQESPNAAETKPDAEIKPKAHGKAEPIADVERLARMMGTNPADMNMEDIKLAFRALEAAAAESGMPLPPNLSGMAGRGGEADKKDSTPVMWTWGDKTVGIYKPGVCEKWRWRNWELGCGVFPEGNGGVGGWEERDWKVFADDRGVDEFEQEQEDAEVDEEDVHDWTC